MKKKTLAIALFITLAGIAVYFAKSPDDLMSQASHLNSKGEYQQALDLFKKIVQEDPENPDGHLQLAFSLQQLERYPEAIQSYQRGLELEPDHPYAAESYFNMSIISESLGDGSQAIKFGKQSLQRYTDRMDMNAVYRGGRRLEHLSQKYSPQSEGSNPINQMP